MIAALLWLTVSAPFVYASQQALVKQGKHVGSNLPFAANEEETAKPLTGTTEEKTPNSGSSFSEEYIHDNHTEEFYFSIVAQYYKFENASTYIAYHGELLVPPPNLL